MEWYGKNSGRANPRPGTVERLACGVCEADMVVERNVTGPTSWAEARAGDKHLHDSFQCPHYNEGWHKKVIALLNEGRATKSERIRAILEEEILEILRTKKVLP
jgi:hypothetical protein